MFKIRGDKNRGVKFRGVKFRGVKNRGGWRDKEIEKDRVDESRQSFDKVK